MFQSCVVSSMRYPINFRIMWFFQKPDPLCRIIYVVVSRIRLFGGSSLSYLVGSVFVLFDSRA